MNGFLGVIVFLAGTLCPGSGQNVVQNRCGRRRVLTLSAAMTGGSGGSAAEPSENTAGNRLAARVSAAASLSMGNNLLNHRHAQHGKAAAFNQGDQHRAADELRLL